MYSTCLQYVSVLENCSVPQLDVGGGCYVERVASAIAIIGALSIDTLAGAAIGHFCLRPAFWCRQQAGPGRGCTSNTWHCYPGHSPRFA
jgi:hypothetical protein